MLTMLDFKPRWDLAWIWKREIREPELRALGSGISSAVDLLQWDQVLAEVVCAYCFQPQHLGLLLVFLGL